MSASHAIADRLRALLGPRQPIVRSYTDCGACGRSVVCPIDWETAGQEHWRISFRCGECGARSERVVTNAAAAALDRRLAAQCDKIRAAADRMERDHMADEVDTFIAALNRDLIAPADFA